MSKKLLLVLLLTGCGLVETDCIDGCNKAYGKSDNNSGLPQLVAELRAVIADLEESLSNVSQEQEALRVTIEQQQELIEQQTKAIGEQNTLLIEQEETIAAQFIEIQRLTRELECNP